MMRVFRLTSSAQPTEKKSVRSKTDRLIAAVCMAATAVTLLPPPALAQQSQPPAQQQSQSQQQQPQPQKPATPGESGGPGGDIGPYAIPKKPEPSATPTPPRVRKPETTPDYTVTSNVNLVQVEVQVTTKDGQVIPGLKKDMFRVYEDGQPQQVTNFNTAEAPITAVLLIEFANTAFVQASEDWLIGSYAFAQTMKKQDWLAVVAYDMRPELLVDFTQDKASVFGALRRLQIPGFRETNEFDALYDTLDRLSGVEGRKYVILVSSGCDSFSKITYDKILKKIKDTPNVAIFAVSTGQSLRLWAESNGYMGALTCSGNPLAGATINRMDLLQSDNEMSTFAKMTGGKSYFPRFEAEFPEIAQDINATIRNEYVLGYHPSNPKQDGTYRKLKVEVVGPDGHTPLKMRDEKGKELKYQVIAREGYTAKHEVE